MARRSLLSLTLLQTAAALAPVVPRHRSLTRPTRLRGMFDFIADAFKNEQFDDRRATARHILVKTLDDVVVRCGAGYDQGTFTEVLYQGRAGAPVSLATTEHGGVFGMICNSLDVRYDEFSEVSNEAGEPYAVVHQFDRFAELARDLGARLPFDGAALLAANASACAGR